MASAAVIGNGGRRAAIVVSQGIFTQLRPRHFHKAVAPAPQTARSIMRMLG
jgi:hypothetical protein